MIKKNKSILTTIAFLMIILASLNVIAQQQNEKSDFGDPIIEDDYTISRSKIDRSIVEREVLEDKFIIENKLNYQKTITLSTDPELSNFIEFDAAGYIIEGNNKTEVSFKIIGSETGTFEGDITLTGGISLKIPVKIEVGNESARSPFLIESESLDKEIKRSEKIDLKVKIKKLLNKEIKNVTFNYYLIDNQDNLTLPLEEEIRDLAGSIEIRKTFNLPEKEYQDGGYTIRVTSEYQNKTLYTNTGFIIYTPFLQIKLFNILPIWLLLVIIISLIIFYIIYRLIRRYIESKKKYKMQLSTATLGKKGERSLFLGKVAEKNIPAWYDMDLMTTHAVVAGATGGGKSISAQVIIEEVLKKNISVIVFDPTAQWSGMLRKCTDKKMLSFYSKFGLKQTDSQAFPGNVRQVRDYRQKIDISKHMNPGQITIFTLNKLDPKQIDIFVAGVIAEIFRSDPKENPELKTVLVFDEVHRLLPKFGGSGKGFLQIERACREFRKWGLGVMLVSQVLSDFVGEIKANINTEVQMRTRDEADLERLKTKYGEEFLQSLIKASVGVGMFVNPHYNRGRPYFINFRPILHNTRRLSDEELDKYNNYGDQIDDIEYQIQELEKEKVDVFDLKMELKLVKDKLMTGNFTVVDIYLEGLKPRLEQQWKKIGKTPKKREIELVEEKDIESSLAKAQEDRKDWKKDGSKKEEAKTEESSKEEDKKEDKTK